MGRSAANRQGVWSPCILTLGSNTTENPGKQLKKHAAPEDKDPHFLYTHLILDLMRPLVSRWSCLTHASHCMTCSSHTDESKSKPSHAPATQGILTPDACPATFRPISRLGDRFRICWLRYPDARLMQLIDT